MFKKINKKTEGGFTIIELLVVVIVIAILAAIVIVAYNGITNRTKEASLKTDLEAGAKQLQIAKIDDGIYPSSANNLKKSINTTFTYSVTSGGFCLQAADSSLVNKNFYITEKGTIKEGTCIGSGEVVADGIAIQLVNSTNCPTTRTRAVDARDNHTYWVQKLGTQCWTLTNLAYAGGGTNTYSDTISTSVLKNGTSNSTDSYTEPQYYIPPNANVTSEPTNPDASTSSSSPTPQFGYLYNWCAAMGGQAQACQNATGSNFTSASICPAGWRLPTGNGGDFAILNATVNSGNTDTDYGIDVNWLGQLSGNRWSSVGFNAQATHGYYWSSTQLSSMSSYSLFFYVPQVDASYYAGKYMGLAVRCLI